MPSGARGRQHGGGGGQVEGVGRGSTRGDRRAQGAFRAAPARDQQASGAVRRGRDRDPAVARRSSTTSVSRCSRRPAPTPRASCRLPRVPQRPRRRSGSTPPSAKQPGSWRTHGPSPSRCGLLPRTRPVPSRPLAGRRPRRSETRARRHRSRPPDPGATDPGPGGHGVEPATSRAGTGATGDRERCTRRRDRRPTCARSPIDPAPRPSRLSGPRAAARRPIPPLPVAKDPPDEPQVAIEWFIDSGIGAGVPTPDPFARDVGLAPEPSEATLPAREVDGLTVRRRAATLGSRRVVGNRRACHREHRTEGRDCRTEQETADDVHGEVRVEDDPAGGDRRRVEHGGDDDHATSERRGHGREDEHDDQRRHHRRPDRVPRGEDEVLEEPRVDARRGLRTDEVLGDHLEQPRDHRGEQAEGDEAERRDGATNASSAQRARRQRDEHRRSAEAHEVGQADTAASTAGPRADRRACGRRRWVVRHWHRSPARGTRDRTRPRRSADRADGSVVRPRRSRPSPRAQVMTTGVPSGERRQLQDHAVVDAHAPVRDALADRAGLVGAVHRDLPVAAGEGLAARCCGPTTRWRTRRSRCPAGSRGRADRCSRRCRSGWACRRCRSRPAPRTAPRRS